MKTTQHDYENHAVMLIVKLSQGLIKMGSVKDVSSSMEGRQYFTIVAHSTGYNVAIRLSPAQRPDEGFCMSVSTRVEPNVGQPIGLSYIKLGDLKIEPGNVYASATSNAMSIISNINQMEYLEY